MINSPNSRISNMAKDFGVKSKTIIDILEANGISGKKNTATLNEDEYGLVMEALTRDNQISNMTQYLAGEVDIPREKKEAPKAEAPKAEAPKTEAPKTEAPKTEAPKTEAPKTEAPKTEAPKTEAPKTEAPKTEAPKTEAPKTEAPKAEAPKAEAPKTEAPKAEAPKAEAPKTEAPKTEAPKTEAPKAEAPKQPVQFRPNTNQRPADNRNNNNNNRGDRPQNNDRNNGQRFGDRPQNGDRSQGQPRSQNGDRQQNGDRNNGQRFGDRPQGQPRSQNGERQQNNGQRFSDRPARDNTRGFSKDDDRDPKEGRPSFRPAAPKPAQPAATSYSKPTATGGSTRVIDTRGAEGNVDLSKYDEKLDTLVPDAAKDLSGSKQKLKKQNNRPQFDKKKRGDKERDAMDKMRREAQEKAKKQQLNVTIPEELQVNELAALLHVTNAEIVKKLMLLGIMASVNQVIDFDTAALIADEFGAKVTKEVVVTIEERLFEEEEDKDEDLIERAPVVCVMGHVDHGKTSLLDAIRDTNVTAGEAGGITQAIGAYRVRINDKDITFLDTPGHEAFTAMRARGAKSTDIAILVVAADDGIMPQTVEAINHAKAADIPIIVAINKMDKPHANPDMVKQSLTNYELVPEEWGGETICVPVSALTRQGIDELLEMVLLVAEMKELKANPNRRAKGLVLESRLDKGRGPVASLLVQTGTLHAGDVLIAGTAVGRVRAMMNDKGRTVKEAGPSIPVEITGLAEIPQAGDEFAVVSDERMARELAEQRRDQIKEEAFKATARANLDTLFAQIKEGVKDLNIIIKADVAGSVEAVKASLIKLSNEEVKVNVIHTAVGGITENDVMLAAASNAIIIGFAVRPDKNALDRAEDQGVEIRTYRIIYECIEEIEAAMKGMLDPEFKETLLGHAEVRQTIHVPNVGTIAGSYILDGKVTRQSKIRIVRDGIVIFEDEISSLKRFKDDAKEVVQGYECGIGLERFNDIKEGDILEAFIMEEVKRG
ncbi:MAG: translation initiation factor IF-2 [Ruminococcaceae bacterium]|nr:translation initiation factor IF-2 [Oscillospiraceae bacterium]